MDKFSTGILRLPVNYKKLVVSLKNNTDSIQEKRFYIFNWDLNKPVLFGIYDYSVAPNRTNVIEAPLAFSEEIGIIKNFEVVYEPFNQNVAVSLATK